jgi:hypothetical protein
MSLVPLLTLATGCGQPQDVDSTEAGQVANLVREVADASGREQSFQALFAADAQPDKQVRAQYARFSYRPADQPAVEGDQATIKVLVRHARDDSDAGELEWTAVREGDAWKLKTAPLPAVKGSK